MSPQFTEMYRRRQLLIETVRLCLAVGDLPAARDAIAAALEEMQADVLQAELGVPV